MNKTTYVGTIEGGAGFLPSTVLNNQYNGKYPRVFFVAQLVSVRGV